jgi:hypothetical protein
VNRGRLIESNGRPTWRLGSSEARSPGWAEFPCGKRSRALTPPGLGPHSGPHLRVSLQGAVRRLVFRIPLDRLLRCWSARCSESTCGPARRAAPVEGPPLTARLRAGAALRRCDRRAAVVVLAGGPGPCLPRALCARRTPVPGQARGGPRRWRSTHAPAHGIARAIPGHGPAGGAREGSLAATCASAPGATTLISGGHRG